MRQAIETAPRDGKTVILEDDASNAYVTARWSRKTYQWVGENGEPIKITPTHWYPRPSDKYRLREDDRSPRRFAAWSVTAALVATAIVALYFRAEVAGYVIQYAGLQHIRGIDRLQVAGPVTQSPGRDSGKSELSATQQVEADQTTAQEGAELKQAGKAPAPVARQSPEQEQLMESLASELAETRRTVDQLTMQLRAETANSAQSRGQEREKAAALAQEADTARRELAASAAQSLQRLDEERARGAALAGELASAKQEIETQAAQLRKASDESRKLRQAEAETISQSLEEERQKTVALAQEAAAARKELTAITAQHRQALDEERARSAVLGSELAAVQRQIEMQARKTDDETRQLKQAEAAKNSRSIDQEREKAAARAIEAAAARQELATSTAQHRQALDEERARRAALWSELATAQLKIEAQAAQLRKASDETEQAKQTAERTIAELRQSLQQERGRTASIPRDHESTRRTSEVRVMPEPATNSPTSSAPQAVEVAATTGTVTAMEEHVHGGAEAIRLIARARALLGQGDIGAARIVLERATEAGSAQASFMLAETYDPAILSGWGTYGTRGEAAKAREFYAKARAGGVKEAKERFEALRQ